MRRLCNTLSGIKADEWHSGNVEVRSQLEVFGKLQFQCNLFH